MDGATKGGELQAERPQATTERRALRMHPRLLWDVIHRQAGSLSKSVLEGVMNSIDAAGSRCDITLTQRKLVIVDDGKGFADRREVEDFFETFGYPHEEGDATYGRFRMGRGQLFAAGRNLWTTNRFVMDVDLKPQGDAKGDDFELGYGLREVPPDEARPGCSIEVDLYEPMNQWMLAHTARAIEEAVAWAQVPVTLNGRRISRLPAEAKWEIEDEDAYISTTKTGNLSVYNLGVLVCHLPASKFGTGGVVVSKRKLDVNFARNAVQSTCPVWKRISKLVDRTVDRSASKTNKLDDAGRERIAIGILDGDRALHTALGQRLITDVTGSHRKLSSLSPNSRTKVPLAVAPTGDRVGDKVLQRKLALVLSQDTLDRFGVATARELLDGLAGAAARDLEARGLPEREWRRSHRDPVHAFLEGLSYLDPVSLDGFRATMLDTHQSVDMKDLKRGERIAVEALEDASRSCSWIMQAWCRQMDLPPPTVRTVLAGESDTAMGWTDGTNHIWVERRHLPLTKTEDGRLKLAGLLVHELLHREPDTETHVHDVEFYRQFHDLCLHTNVLHAVSDRLRASMERRIEKADRNAGVEDTPVADDLAAPGPEALDGEDDGPLVLR